MARPLRVDFPGALHHVTARGNGRQSIYLDRDDRLGFLELLQQCVNRFGWLIHTYCLMGNHFHLLIETPLANLARGMRQLNGVYAQTFNRRHGTVGHLFQARYGARLVQREEHGLAVVRYIVRNPVRAGLCEHPGEWPWSSYNATAGHEPAPRFLTTEWVVGQLGSELRAARDRFRRFVLEGPELDPAIAGLYQGDRAFAEEHAPARPIPEIPRRHTMPVRPPLAQLVADGSPGAIAVAYAHGYTLDQIARQLGRHYTTISRRLARYEQRTAEASRPMR